MSIEIVCYYNISRNNSTLFPKLSATFGWFRCICLISHGRLPSHIRTRPCIMAFKHKQSYTRSVPYNSPSSALSSLFRSLHFSSTYFLSSHLPLVSLSLSPSLCHLKILSDRATADPPANQHLLLPFVYIE